MRVLLLFIFLGLASCGVVSERSIYEGVRSNERAKSAGTDNADNADNADKALPNYDQYNKEREAIRK